MAFFHIYLESLFDNKEDILRNMRIKRPLHHGKWSFEVDSVKLADQKRTRTRDRGGMLKYLSGLTVTLNRPGREFTATRMLLGAFIHYIIAGP